LIVDSTFESKLIEVPRFFIQPLIENAYIHGFHQRQGSIWIRSWVEQGSPQMLNVIVQDQGAGMTEEQLNMLRECLNHSSSPALRKQTKDSLSGIGLHNIYARLKLVYGEKFTMTIESKLSFGTTITFEIPIKTGDEHV